VTATLEGKPVLNWHSSGCDDGTCNLGKKIDPKERPGMFIIVA
jgi:hypothetical protein